MSVLTASTRYGYTLPGQRLQLPALPSRGGGRTASVMRRRRLVALLALVVVAAVLATSAPAWFGGRSAAADPALSQGPVRVGVDGAVLQPAAALRDYRVLPGDTLWSIATRLSGDQDPRPMVDRLAQINGLSNQQLTVGSVLLLPTHTDVG